MESLSGKGGMWLPLFSSPLCQAWGTHTRPGCYHQNYAESPDALTLLVGYSLAGV